MRVRGAPWTATEIQEAQRLAEEHGRTEAARRLGVSRPSLDSILKRKKQAPDMVVETPPPAEIPIDELLAQRVRRYEQKRRHEEARRLIGIRVREQRPIGILHFGDPHVDDDGCDVKLLGEHARLVRSTPGLFAANVGDTRNNWIGRLAALWGEQSSSANEARQLARWFFDEAGWLRDLGDRGWIYIVGGNHDLWSGANDPFKWIAEQTDTLYQDSEVRAALRFPGGMEVKVNCRHDFAGNSQWNPAHGPMKAGLLGTRDHILIAGHKHISAYGILKDPESGAVLHSILVAGYKVYDRYARAKGFRDQRISPSCVTVIDPTLPEHHPGLVTVFWDPFQGAEYLTWLRKSRRAA